MTSSKEEKSGNNGGGKSRKRRPAGYPERHAKALEWMNENLHILYIFPSTEDKLYGSAEQWIAEQDAKMVAAYTGGRPPDYKPQYCIDMMYGGRMGRSLYQIARDIGTVSMALHRWGAKYEDFRYAVSFSKEWKTAWLEDMAMGQISGTIKGNAGMLRFALVNADPKRYADVKVIEARMANKPADEAPAIDFNAIPIEDRLLLMQGFRQAARASIEGKLTPPDDSDDVIDADFTEE